MLRTLLIVIVLLLLIGSLPSLGYSSGWGVLSERHLRSNTAHRCYSCSGQEDLTVGGK